MMEFRKLKAEEIECRIQTVKENGISLLLYKDARVDQRLLDETVGPMNWQREHSRDNANCIVSIWDSDKKMWVKKEDTGTESNTEAAKGLASDSFKRACFNWGIGRELYSAPFIWITPPDCTVKPGRGDRLVCYDRYYVSKIGYAETGDINVLEIKNEKTHKVVYAMGTQTVQTKETSEHITEAQIKTLSAAAAEAGSNMIDVVNHYVPGGTVNDMTVRQYVEALALLNKKRLRQEQGA